MKITEEELRLVRWSSGAGVVAMLSFGFIGACQGDLTQGFIGFAMACLIMDLLSKVERL